MPVGGRSAEMQYFVLFFDKRNSQNRNSGDAKDALSQPCRSLALPVSAC